MDSEDNKLLPTVKTSGELARRPTPGTILDSTVEQLPENEKRKLAAKIAAEKVELGLSAEKAEQRHFESARDMANTLRVASTAERTIGSDYDVRSSHETASGRTDIHIKKNNNTVIIVIAVVIGIIVLLFLRH